jgi:large subunit ribosomal protein L46
LCSTPSSSVSLTSRAFTTSPFPSQAATATAESPQPISPLDGIGSDPTAAVSPEPTCTVNAGIVLSRPPLITRDLTPFEKSFYFYQQRLNERLALPFTRYFYYQTGTPGDVEWKRKVRERQARGDYSAYGPLAWNDELLVGAKDSEPEALLEKLITEDEVPGEFVSDESKKEIQQRPQPRRTTADEQNDIRSLNRRLDRTLYLLVQGKDGSWSFPASRLTEGEALHDVC